MHGKLPTRDSNQNATTIAAYLIRIALSVLCGCSSLLLALKRIVVDYIFPDRVRLHVRFYVNLVDYILPDRVRPHVSFYVNRIYPVLLQITLRVIS